MYCRQKRHRCRPRKFIIRNSFLAFFWIRIITIVQVLHSNDAFHYHDGQQQRQRDCVFRITRQMKMEKKYSLTTIPRSTTYNKFRLYIAGEGEGNVSSRYNADNANALTTPTKWMIRKVLDILRDSDFIKRKHKEHIESDSVTHLLKGTPFVSAPGEWKLLFVDSWVGRAISTIIEEEGIYLRQWKIDCICEAAAMATSTTINPAALDGTTAADYSTTINATTVREIWGPEALSSSAALRSSSTIKSNNTIIVYSFEDCPWCIAAINLLRSMPSIQNNESDGETTTTTTTTKLIVIELEHLGFVGKQLRAILAKDNGRTSMPCIYINGKCIGGYTDGEPCGMGLKAMYETGQLQSILDE